MRTASLALAVGALLVAAAPAAADIAPQHGIGGVRIGDTQAKVLKTRGTPVAIVNGSNDFGPYRELRYRGLTVTLQGRTRVTSVSTRSRAERTRSGAGVGSTETALNLAVRGLTCETFGDVRSCTLGVQEAGRRVTVFFLSKGRVNRVVVGNVLD
ncbi:MAG: hypothetical protein U0237_17550 [Thermoleophilia bacterium]